MSYKKLFLLFLISYINNNLFSSVSTEKITDSFTLETYKNDTNDDKNNIAFIRTIYDIFTVSYDLFQNSFLDLTKASFIAYYSDEEKINIVMNLWNCIIQHMHSFGHENLIEESIQFKEFLDESFSEYFSFKKTNATEL